MDGDDPYGLVGTVLNGKYRVERPVAEGGFGVVYQGLHLSLEKRIALKVLKLRPDVSPKMRASIATKFRREAQTLAKLSHPALVQALDLDVSMMPSGAEAPWMVLEWIDGPSLKAWLRARPGGPMVPAPQALALLRPIFEALATAHDAGIAHRDIKPSNIMVDTRRNSVLRLMDFGIAKLMEDGSEGVPSLDLRTVSEFPTYSARYAAPEQALGRKTGPWTDVHALGLLLTEVLVGGPAYREKDAARLLGETLETKRPSPGNQVPPLDVGPWEPVILRALNINPAERYPNAGEFLAALENTLPASSASTQSPIASARAATPVHGYQSVDPFAPTASPPGVAYRQSAAPATPPVAPAAAQSFARTVVETPASGTAPAFSLTVVEPSGASVVAPPPTRVGDVAGGPSASSTSRVAGIVVAAIAALSLGGGVTWLVSRQRAHAHEAVSSANLQAPSAQPPAESAPAPAHIQQSAPEPSPNPAPATVTEPAATATQDAAVATAQPVEQSASSHHGHTTHAHARDAGHAGGVRLDPEFQ